MKLKKLAILTACGFTFLTGVAQANVLIQMNSPTVKNNGGACSQIYGSWKGNAEIATLPVHCKYDGHADVRAADKNGRFNIRVDLHPKSGFWFCPKTDAFNLSGTCVAGTIKIDTPDSVRLSGTTDGHSVHVSGDININPKTSVHVVALDLTKQ